MTAPATTTGAEALLDPQIRQACRQLRLPTIGSRAAAVASEAVREGRTHLAYLAALLEAELDDRTERRRHRRIAEARFPRLKRLHEFNFDEARRSLRQPSGSSPRWGSSTGRRT